MAVELDLTRLATLYEGLVAVHDNAEHVRAVAARSPGLRLRFVDSGQTLEAYLIDLDGSHVSVGTFDRRELDPDTIAAADEVRDDVTAGLEALARCDADVERDTYDGLVEGLLEHFRAVAAAAGLPFAVEDLDELEHDLRGHGRDVAADGARRLREGCSR